MRFNCLLLFFLSLFLQNSFAEEYNLWDPSPLCVEQKLCPEVSETEGYLNYEERIMHYLINSARLDPTAFLKKLGLDEFPCMVDLALGSTPLYWNSHISGAAKLHAYQMAQDPSCYKLETCKKHCDLFGGCSYKERLKAYSQYSMVPLIAKGNAMNALSELLSNEDTCRQLMSPRWSEIGVGLGKGEENYWSFVLKESTNFIGYPIISGTHHAIAAQSSLQFEAVYNDIRLDEGLKEIHVVVDGVIYPMKAVRSSKLSWNERGRTGVYEVTLPFSMLERLAQEEKNSEDNHCHFYYFHFRTEHTFTTFRLPESGFFYLTGFGGCQEIFTAESPTTPHSKRLSNEALRVSEERKKELLERDRKRQEEREFKLKALRKESLARESGEEGSSSVVGYGFAAIGLVLVAILFLRKKRVLRKLH